MDWEKRPWCWQEFPMCHTTDNFRCISHHTDNTTTVNAFWEHAGSFRKNNDGNPAILCNEELKTGIQTSCYVPHINACWEDNLPLFREWQQDEDFSTTAIVNRARQGSVCLLPYLMCHVPCHRTTGCCLYRQKQIPGLHGLGVLKTYTHTKGKTGETDCSINASYKDKGRYYGMPRGALEIKYNVWVAQFEVQSKKKKKKSNLNCQWGDTYLHAN